MKVSDASKSPPPKRVGKTAQTGAPQGAAAAAPVDSISIAGIPDAELTPRVRQALATLIEEVQSLREELASAHARMRELEELADSDPLLGVLNRRAFVRELERTLALVERYGTPASLVFADLNDLKKINDSMGHAAGDAALAHVAAIIRENIRQTDAVGRLGGDEFGLILLQADNETAKEKAASLASAVAAAPVSFKELTFVAQVSCGVVEIRKGWSAADALETADSAMYEVKRKR